MDGCTGSDKYGQSAFDNCSPNLCVILVTVDERTLELKPSRAKNRSALCMVIVRSNRKTKYTVCSTKKSENYRPVVPRVLKFMINYVHLVED